MSQQGNTAGQVEHYNELLERTKQSLILMVDDEPIISDITEAHLQCEGYSRFVAENDSRKALQVLSQHPVDLLLLDLNMPHVNGFEILEAVRENPRYRSLPIIVMTSAADSETKIRALNLGATDFLAKPVDPAELQLRVRNCLAAKVYERQLLYFDSVTYLPNRTYFHERLKQLLVEEPEEEFVLFTLSIDQLKRIQDGVGAEAANEVMRQLAQSLGGVVAQPDISTGAEWVLLAKSGGDEFSCVLRGTSDVGVLRMLANDIKLAVEQNCAVGSHEFYVSASVGVAVYPNHAQDSEELARAAAGASAEAKGEGGNTCRLYTERLGQIARRQLSMDSSLRRALDRHELFLMYQPKVDIARQRITGAEALIRWRTSDGELISPEHFIPLAEETGLIVPIGQWVVTTACFQLRAWEAQGMAKMNMAINVAAAQFFDSRFVDSLQFACNSAKVDPKQITVEMTEGTLVGEDAHLPDTLKRIKAMGAQISIDDFGTGYSSLSYLKRFPLDELKIDRSFIRDLANDESDSAIVQAIISMAHSLGLQVVAEGVEDAEQLKLLGDYGCRKIQGFYFSKPRMGDEFVSFAKRFNMTQGNRQMG
ncbi:putative bifunctional diguanylate cyclase/phosphodiesterase [Halioxenophilus aromaticivorans]|uniref:cyclic-guanylate-specific phosphodiesterase n=1 Tax=Halioxenophilus aromaticivorans TaxID=1306992 RepID=A0AAV3U5D2_9ALTE